MVPAVWLPELNLSSSATLVGLTFSSPDQYLQASGHQFSNLTTVLHVPLVSYFRGLCIQTIQAFLGVSWLQSQINSCHSYDFQLKETEDVTLPRARCCEIINKTSGPSHTQAAGSQVEIIQGCRL